MPSKLYTLLTAINVCSSIVQAGFGTSYSIALPQPYSNFYRKLSATLTVPETQKPQKSFLYLWPGLDTRAPLFQPVLAGFETPSAYDCDATEGQWCLWLYIYGYSDSGKEAPKVAVSPGETLDMTIEYNGNNQGYTQTVMRNSQVISTLTGGAGDGVARRAQVQVECAGDARGQTPAHTYSNFTMVLGTADPDFKATGDIYDFYSIVSDLYTDDNGLTWKIDTINMQASDCTPEITTPTTSAASVPSDITPPPTPAEDTATVGAKNRHIHYTALLALTITYLFLA